MPFSPEERAALIARYAAGPGVLTAALGRVPSDAVPWRPAPGRWSAHEIVVHCADAETNAYSRLRYLVAQPEPVIQGYDQDRWAETLDYHALPLDTALATVEAVRAATVPLLRRLGDREWRRIGRHTESGAYSAEDWLAIYAAHLEQHAQQLERNVAAWQSR
jgi:DinB superfamily